MKCGKPYCACVGTCFAQQSPLDDAGQLLGHPMTNQTPDSTKPETRGERNRVLVELRRMVKVLRTDSYDLALADTLEEAADLLAADAAAREHAYRKGFIDGQIDMRDRAADGKAGGEVVGYLPAYELSRLNSGHDANLRSAKFGPSALNGDVPVYTRPQQAAQVAQPLSDFQEGQWWVAVLDAMTRDAGTDDQKRAMAVVHHMLRSAVQAKQPMTDDEIAACTQHIALISKNARWNIARCIEAAHGIGKDQA